MSGVGELLRRSGAFFIKRNVRDDPVYRALLMEYVQTIVKVGQQPLEFFIEGTRSRTAKALPPKIGTCEERMFAKFYVSAQLSRNLFDYGA